jgi:hemin uptake protein HemP
MLPSEFPKPETLPNDPVESLPQARVIPAEQLFAGDREVWIEHEGARYRLRITRRNKLILQK